MRSVYIQYCINIRVLENLFALDSTRFVNGSKKGSCRLFEENTPKIRSFCFKTRLQQMISRGFTRMSPKVNSRRLFGYFKMSQKKNEEVAAFRMHILEITQSGKTTSTFGTNECKSV